MRRLTVFFLSMAFSITLYGQGVGYLMYLSEDNKCEFGSFDNYYAYEFKKFPDFRSAESYYYSFESSRRKDPSHRVRVIGVRKDQYFAVILVTQTYPKNYLLELFQKLELYTSNLFFMDGKQKNGIMEVMDYYLLVI